MRGKTNRKRFLIFFTSKGVANRYATAYEQHQDGLSEAGIKSIFWLARSGMAESGLGGRFWFSAATCGKDCRNVTYKDESRIHLGVSCMAKRRTYRNSDRLDAGDICG